jgi:dihydropteroate synthase
VGVLLARKTPYNHGATAAAWRIDADVTRPYRLMGVLNVTPDSFSDGGRFLAPERAIEHGLRLMAEGADIVDIGGESTRPGAEPVGLEEERSRVIPVIEGLAAAAPASTQISIDTSKAAVAEVALAAGASLVNDVTALRADLDMAAVVADSGAACCLMHMRGEPRTMQADPRYGDVVDEVKAFLEERLAFAVREGVGERRVLIDPGIGFGKTVEHNLELVRRLDELLTLGRPIVIGTSRKSFLGRIAAEASAARDAAGPAGGGAARDGAVVAAPFDVASRLPGTLASNVLALERGASVFRVHDVAPVREALAVAAATLGERWTARSIPTTPTS